MIKIIKGEITHSELIAKIGKEAFLESHGDSASKENLDDFLAKTYHKEALQKELENPKFLYHLIYSQNKIAGYSKIQLNTPSVFIKHQNVTKLDRFYLLKEFYGQNLGASLFNFNIELSKQNEQKGIWLAVWVKNQRAIHFYTKVGFKIVGEYNFQISKTHSNPNHIMYLEY